MCPGLTTCSLCHSQHKATAQPTTEEQPFKLAKVLLCVAAQHTVCAQCRRSPRCHLLKSEHDAGCNRAILPDCMV